MRHCHYYECGVVATLNMDALAKEVLPSGLIYICLVIFYVICFYSNLGSPSYIKCASKINKDTNRTNRPSVKIWVGIYN